MRISYLLSSCSICLCLLVSEVYGHTGLRKNGLTTYHSRFRDSLLDDQDCGFRDSLFDGYDKAKSEKYKKTLSGSKRSTIDSNIKLKVMKCYDGTEQQILEAMQYTDRALDVCTWNNWDIFNLIKNYHDEFKPEDNGKFSLKQINTIAYASFGYYVYSKLDKLCIPGRNNEALEKEKKEILETYYKQGEIAKVIESQFATALNGMPGYIKPLFGNIMSGNNLNALTKAAQGVENFVHLTRGVHSIIGEFDYRNELAINSKMLDIKNLADLFGLNKIAKTGYTDSQIINLSNANLMEQLQATLQDNVYNAINKNISNLDEIKDKDKFAEAVSDVIAIPDSKNTGWNDKSQRDELKTRLFALYKTKTGKDLLKNMLALGWLARLMDGQKIKLVNNDVVKQMSGDIPQVAMAGLSKSTLGTVSGVAPQKGGMVEDVTFSVDLDKKGISAITKSGKYLDKITFKPIVLRYKGSNDANFEMPGYEKVPNHIIEVSKLEKGKPDALLHELNHYFISIVFHNIEENDQINSTALKYDEAFSQYAYWYNNNEYVNDVATKIYNIVQKQIPNGSSKLSSVEVTPLTDEEKRAGLGVQSQKDEKKDLGQAPGQGKKVTFATAIEDVKDDWQLERLLKKNGLLYRTDVQNILMTKKALDDKKKELEELNVYSDQVRKDIINRLYAEYKTENYENRVADEIRTNVEDIYKKQNPDDEDLVKMCVVIRVFDRRCNPFSNANEMLTIIGATPYWFGDKKFLIVNPNSEHDYFREKFKNEKLRFKHCTNELLFSLLYGGPSNTKIDEGPAQFVKLGVPNDIAQAISDYFKNNIESTPAETNQNTFVSRTEIGSVSSFPSDLPYAWTSASYFYGGHVGSIISKAENIMDKYDPDNQAEADIGVFLIQNLEQNSIYTQKLVAKMIDELHKNLKNDVSINGDDQKKYNTLRSVVKHANDGSAIKSAQEELNKFLEKYETKKDAIKDLRKYLIFDRLYEWLVAYSFDFIKNETIIDVLGKQRDIPFFGFDMGMALWNMKDGYDGNYIRWFINSVFEKVKWTGVFAEKYGKKAADLYKIEDKEKIEFQDLFKLCNVLCGAYKFPSKIRNNMEVLAALTWASICPDHFHERDGLEYVLKLYKEDRDKGVSPENCRGLNPDMFVAVCSAFPRLSSNLEVSLNSIYNAYNSNENQQKYFQDISAERNDVMRYAKNKSAAALIHKCLWDTCSISVVDSNYYAGLLLADAYVSNIYSNALNQTEKDILKSYINNDKDGDVFEKEVWDDILLYLYIFSKDKKEEYFGKVKRDWCNSKELYDYLSKFNEKNVVKLIADILAKNERININGYFIVNFFYNMLNQTLYHKDKSGTNTLWDSVLNHLEAAKLSDVIKLCRNSAIYSHSHLMFGLYCFYKGTKADNLFVKWFKGENVTIDGIEYTENDVYLRSESYLNNSVKSSIPADLPYTCMLLNDYDYASDSNFKTHLARVGKLLGNVKDWTDIQDFSEKVQSGSFTDLLRKYCIWNAANSTKNFNDIQTAMDSLINTIDNKGIWLLLNVFGTQFELLSTCVYNSNDKLRNVLLYNLCNAAINNQLLNVLNNKLPIIKSAPQKCRTLNHPLKELILKDLSFESVVNLFCAGIRWDYHNYEYFYYHDSVSKDHNYQSDGRNDDKGAFRESLLKLVGYVENGTEDDKKTKRLAASKLFWSPHFEYQASTITAVMTLWGANCEVKTQDVKEVLNRTKKPEDLIKESNGNLFAKTSGGKLSFPLFIDMLEHNSINLQTDGVSNETIQTIEEFKQYKDDTIKVSTAIKDLPAEQKDNLEGAVIKITNKVIDEKITEFMQLNRPIADDLTQSLNGQGQTKYYTMNAALRNFICNDQTAILSLLELGTKEKVKFEMLLNKYVQLYLNSLGNDAVISEIRNNYNSGELSENLKKDVQILQQKRIVTNYVAAKTAIFGQDDVEILQDEDAFLNKLRDKINSKEISMEDEHLETEIYWDVSGNRISMEAFNNLGARNILLSIRDILLIVHHNETPVSIDDLHRLLELSKRNSGALDDSIIWIKHRAELMRESAKYDEKILLNEIINYFTREKFIDYSKHKQINVNDQEELQKLREELDMDFNQEDADFITAAIKMDKPLKNIADKKDVAEERSVNYQRATALVEDIPSLRIAISEAQGNTPEILKDWGNILEFKETIDNVKTEYKEAKALVKNPSTLRSAISNTKGETPESLKNWENIPEFKENIENIKTEYTKAKLFVEDSVGLRSAISKTKGETPEILKDWENIPEFKNKIDNVKAEYKEAKELVGDIPSLRSAISNTKGETPESLKNWENISEFKDILENTKADYKGAKADFYSMLDERSLFEFIKYIKARNGCVITEQLAQATWTSSHDLLEKFISVYEKLANVRDKSEFEKTVSELLKPDDAMLFDLETATVVLAVAKDNPNIDLLKKILADKQYDYSFAYWENIAKLCSKFGDFADCLQEIILIDNIGLDYKEYGFNEQSIHLNEDWTNIQSQILKNLIAQSARYIVDGAIYDPDDSLKGKFRLTPNQKRVIKFEQIRNLPIGHLAFSKWDSDIYKNTFYFCLKNIQTGRAYIKTNIETEILLQLILNDKQSFIPLSEQIRIINDVSEETEGDKSFKANLADLFVMTNIKSILSRLKSGMSLDAFSETIRSIIDNAKSDGKILSKAVKDSLLKYEYSGKVKDLSIEKIFIIELAKKIVSSVDYDDLYDYLDKLQDDHVLDGVFSDQVLEDCLKYVHKYCDEYNVIDRFLNQY